jgi:hypothetical protein
MELNRLKAECLKDKIDRIISENVPRDVYFAVKALKDEYGDA